jgi:hypothetical protein
LSKYDSIFGKKVRFDVVFEIQINLIVILLIRFNVGRACGGLRNYRLPADACDQGLFSLAELSPEVL